MKMAILAGKFIYGDSMKLQPRVFLVPWARMIMLRCCSTQPVRYTPKRSSTNKKLETSSSSIPTEGSKNNKFRQSKNPNLSNVWSPNSVGSFYADEKSQKVHQNEAILDVESDNRLNSVVKTSESGEEIDHKWSPKESKLMGKLDEVDVTQEPEEAVDEPEAHDGTYLRPEESNLKEKLSEHAVTEELEEAFDGLETYNGKFETKLFALQARKTKEAERMANTEMEEEIDYKQRPEESKLMEELAEDAVIEESEEGLDELEIHNGIYLFNHLNLEDSKTKEQAMNMAIRLLAVRAFTILELKKKLRAKKYPHKIIDAVIADIQGRGLINDFLYAEAFCRSKYSSSCWAPKRIKQALARKGVAEIDAEKAVKLVVEDGESGDDQVSVLGLSKSSMDHLFAQALKQWLRGQDEPIEKRKSRIINWLQYRGFDYRIINFILKKLVSEGVESCDDEGSSEGSSKASMDDLVAQASKQWLRYGDAPIEKRKSRIIRWLQYRRFNWGVINYILKELQSKYPP